MTDPTFTYDVSTDRGMVRLLLNDVDEATMVFTDTEIDAFLALEGQDVKYAAAQAIDTNATNEALASKVIRDHQLATDGAKLADAMRKHADRLREQADGEDTGFTLVSPVARCRRPPELTERPYPFC